MRSSSGLAPSSTSSDIPQINAWASETYAKAWVWSNAHDNIHIPFAKFLVAKGNNSAVRISDNKDWKEHTGASQNVAVFGKPAFLLMLEGGIEELKGVAKSMEEKNQQTKTSVSWGLWRKLCWKSVSK